jgi:hypothetical protein
MILVSAEYNRSTGIGNKLFPWSRAKIFANETGGKMLTHYWFSPRAAAITRGGIDYGNALSKIWLLNNFCFDPKEMSIVEGKLKSAKLERIYVDNLSDARNYARDNCHLVFRWNSSHEFSELWHYRDFIKEKLLSLARPSHVEFSSQYDGTPFIAMNVRTGKDFISKSSGKLGYYLTELDWFEAALLKVRKNYGNLPALIVSDGGTRELRQLLALPDVKLVQSSSAIADLLTLAKAKVLLGSGNSSFSAWASFLGGMPSYSSKETPFDKFKLSDGNQVVAIL